jgi:hypothetical protein
MEMLNQIAITWVHYPRSEIFAVRPHGLTHAQLRHYAVQAGFHDFQDDDGNPLLIGARSARGDLICLLESAGYEITSARTAIAKEEI